MTGALKQPSRTESRFFTSLTDKTVRSGDIENAPVFPESEHVALSDSLLGLALIPFSKALLDSLRVQFPSEQQALYHDSEYVALSEKLVGRALNQTGGLPQGNPTHHRPHPLFVKDCTPFRSNICQPFIQHC